MKLRYTGPKTAVFVPAARQEAIAQGETIDVTSELAKDLLEQPGWRRVNDVKDVPPTSDPKD